MVNVEVVVDSVDDALAAADAGVSRVEVGYAPILKSTLCCSAARWTC